MPRFPSPEEAVVPETWYALLPGSFPLGAGTMAYRADEHLASLKESYAPYGPQTISNYDMTAAVMPHFKVISSQVLHLLNRSSRYVVEVRCPDLPNGRESR